VQQHIASGPKGLGAGVLDLAVADAILQRTKINPSKRRSAFRLIELLRAKVSRFDAYGLNNSQSMLHDK
jgi:hypothetical protein